jgi:hypothetical protein
LWCVNLRVANHHEFTLLLTNRKNIVYNTYDAPFLYQTWANWTVEKGTTNTWTITANPRLVCYERTH